MIFLTDSTGECIYAGAEWITLTGQRSEDALGQRWLERVHPDDKSIVKDIYFKATQIAAEFNIRYRLLKADGTCRWVGAGGIPSFGVRQDSFNGYIGTITELAVGATDTIKAYGSIEPFQPPAPHAMTTPTCALDLIADHLIIAHSLIQNGSGKEALPEVRKALFKIGQALAKRIEAKARLEVVRFV